MQKIIRQGDVTFIEVEKVEGEVKKHAHLTVAYGEATGHHHTLYPSTEFNPGVLSGEPSSFIEEYVSKDKRFIKLDTEWLLKHQEHNALSIPAGTYEITIERTRDPFKNAIKRAVD